MSQPEAKKELEPQKQPHASFTPKQMGSNPNLTRFFQKNKEELNEKEKFTRSKQRCSTAQVSAIQGLNFLFKEIFIVSVLEKKLFKKNKTCEILIKKVY
jgi:hypothetical protein